jgi:hypothetical protein
VTEHPDKYTPPAIERPEDVAGLLTNQGGSYWTPRG